MTSNTMDAEYDGEYTDTIMVSDLFTMDTAISDVTGDPVFGDYGRLIFPVDDWYYSGDTLVFFKGNPGERFAVCNAGGAFAYVGAMHDSFPHALELSKQGYNTFALIYRCRTDFADIQSIKECGGNRQWQRRFLKNWAANMKDKAIIYYRV